MNQEDQRAQLEQEDNDQLYSAGYRGIWPSQRQYVRNDYDDNEVEERKENEYSANYVAPATLRLLEGLIKNNLIQAKQANRFNRDRYDEVFKELENSANNYGTERFHQTVNDVREFPQEDPEDFTFKEDQDGEVGDEHAGHGMVMEEDDLGGNIDTTNLANMEFVDSNPTEFGYSPSDPRFFENFEPESTTVHKGHKGEFCYLIP